MAMSVVALYVCICVSLSMCCLSSVSRLTLAYLHGGFVCDDLGLALEEQIDK